MAGVCLALLATALALLAPGPVRAANVLSDPMVSPDTGTIETIFEFSVIHTSSPQGFTPSSVTVTVAGIDLAMAAIGGDPDTGLTYRVTGTLPAGSWTATFSAVVANGGTPTPVAWPDTIVVTVSPTPTPGPTSPPTPAPTPTPSPSPMPTPTPTAVPTPLPPGQTPRPTPRPTPAPPGSTPAPAPESDELAPAGPSGSGTPSPAHTVRPDPSSVPSAAAASPAPDPSPTPGPSAASGSGGGVGRFGWIVLGGMTSAAGAFVLGRQWLSRRRAG